MIAALYAHGHTDTPPATPAQASGDYPLHVDYEVYHGRQNVTIAVFALGGDEILDEVTIDIDDAISWYTSLQKDLQTYDTSDHDGEHLQITWKLHPDELWEQMTNQELLEYALHMGHLNRYSAELRRCVAPGA